MKSEDETEYVLMTIVIDAVRQLLDHKPREGMTGRELPEFFVETTRLWKELEDTMAQLDIYQKAHLE